jgi:hypothetical protein
MRIERRIERLPLEQRERIKKADDLWLQVTLSAGGKPAKDVIRLAKTCSIGVGRLRRIAKRIGVVHVKDGVDGGWIWTLPGAPAVAPAVAGQRANTVQPGVSKTSI